MRKSVLVTGASKGIGRAIGELYAKNGYDVIVNYCSDTNSALVTKETIESYGVKCCLKQFDLSDIEAVKNNVENIIKEFKCIDVLVNNAGIALIKDFSSTKNEEIQRMYEVILKGTMNITKALYDHFAFKGKGHIVNISSMWGEVGSSCEVAYSTFKAGIIGFTKALSKELAPSNVFVNCVSPGVIETDMLKGLSFKELDELIAEIPLEKLGKPFDVAKAVYFLGSDENEYITGQVLRVNGGMVV